MSYISLKQEMFFIASFDLNPPLLFCCSFPPPPSVVLSSWHIPPPHSGILPLLPISIKNVTHQQQKKRDIIFFFFWLKSETGNRKLWNSFFDFSLFLLYWKETETNKTKNCQMFAFIFKCIFFFVMNFCINWTYS